MALAWLVAVVLSMPALVLTLDSPVVDQTSRRFELLTLGLTVLTRVWVIAVPLVYEQLARISGSWGRLALPLGFSVLSLGLFLPMWRPFSLDTGWAALAGHAPVDELRSFVTTPSLQPGRTYRVLTGADSKYGIYQVVRHGGVLDSELFPESLHRASFGSRRSYAAFLADRRVQSIVVAPSYRHAYHSNEPRLVAAMAASGRVHRGHPDRRGGAGRRLAAVRRRALLTRRDRRVVQARHVGTRRAGRFAAVVAIEVSGLRKSYGSLDAVRGLDFRVEEGEVFALLGPNGAGKTTTLEILEGFRTRTAGEVRVLGEDPARAGRAQRQRVGIVLQGVVSEPYLTVREVLTRNAAYYPNPRPVVEVIEHVGLGEKADARVKTLSGGQLRRLDVGLGIIGDPELLFLDEPTTGFDPTARRSAWELVRQLRGAGKTIVLTTHYMDEAQSLADRVAVINAGVIVAEGTPDTIGGRAQAAARIRFHLPPGVTVGELPVTAGDADGAVELHTDDPVRALHTLTGWAFERGVALEGLTVDRPSLEDVYLALISEEDEA